MLIQSPHSRPVSLTGFILNTLFQELNATDANTVSLTVSAHLLSLLNAFTLGAEECYTI